MDESKLVTIQDRLNYLDHLPTLKEKEEFFLRNTIQHFTNDTRCTDEEGRCLYYHSQKEGCAIGRFLSDKEKCKKWDASFRAVNVATIEKELHQELLSLPDQNGITKYGIKNVEKICQSFDLAFSNVICNGKIDPS